MSRALIIFGTTDGHTAKVAWAIANQLSRSGHEADLIDARDGEPNPAPYDAVVVAASVHAGGYQRQIAHWVSKHVAALDRKPNAFVSVCLGVLQHDPKVDLELQSMLDRFFESTGWRPLETKIVAGALKYTQYNFIKRWIMKRIVKMAKGDTDTTRDYEYTDWDDLRQFTVRFAERLDTRTAAKTA
jgi:menaquinone-dependent protoporphyrinogen oxidase